MVDSDMTSLPEGCFDINGLLIELYARPIVLFTPHAMKVPDWLQDPLHLLG
jgi:hypothetical protein